MNGSIRRIRESKPGPRCACGKSSFRSIAHARAHARNVHSERMRIYRCTLDPAIYHLTNNDKGRASIPGNVDTSRKTESRKATSKRIRVQGKRECRGWFAEPGPSA